MRFIPLFKSDLLQGGKLLRNYTQNIDTLEQEAGISRVIQCHGSFATASCSVCKRQVADGITIHPSIHPSTDPSIHPSIHPGGRRRDQGGNL